MKNLVLALLCPFAFANAQAVSFGIIGGFPFNSVEVASPPESAPELPTGTNYAVRPSIQVNLPANFRFEADMLCRPYDLNENTLILGAERALDNVRISGSQFRFPLLLQYRLDHHRLKPYVEAGLSIDHLGNVSAINTFTVFIGGTSTTTPGEIPNAGPGSLIVRTHAGVVAGAGIELKIPLVRLSCEVRYTRQGDYFSNFSTVNQGEMLLGIHF